MYNRFFTWPRLVFLSGKAPNKASSLSKYEQEAYFLLHIDVITKSVAF